MITRYLDIFKPLISVIVAIVAATGIQGVSAFDRSMYAEHSVLADGNWVKISVDHDDVYYISNATLRQWGFGDPAAVNVYGYGGRRLSDVLDKNMIDDLPLLQVVRTDTGIYFYGEGPTETNMRQGRYLYPSNNPFSTVGYYFLSDRGAKARGIPEADLLPGIPESPVTSIQAMAHHELEANSPGEIGHLLVGEDFKFTRSQSFSIDMPGRVENTEVNMMTSFVALLSQPGKISFTADDERISINNTFENTVQSTSSAYSYGIENFYYRQFIPSGTRTKIGVNFSATGTVSSANLNYISLTYLRRLALTNGALTFTAFTDTAFTVAGATASTHILDVTDHLNITAVKGQVSSSGVTWGIPDSGIARTYALFNEGANVPSPKLVGKAANQDLHSLPTTDMVIITVDDWANEAERLAEFHRNSPDSLSVTVVPQSVIYNEFGSGSADVNALRKMLKMFYDRGGDGGTLRYVLLMGRATSDNRRLTSTGKSLSYTPMPTWLSDSGLDQNLSYTTDDIFAFLSDNSGRSLSSDKMRVAIGRLPVKSVNEAAAIVDKIISYASTPRPGDWRNRVLLVSDDGDHGDHMNQTEAMAECMFTSYGGDDMNYQKLYIDAYEHSNGTYPQARTDMFRTLDDGIIWWNYIGHANPTSWTHDGLMTYTDINSLYLKYQPFVYAATCDFMRWDCAQISGAEILFLNDGSGTIGTISATRPVYINENGWFSRSIGRYAFSRNANGQRYTVGEIMQHAKNNYATSTGPTSNSNKLRYVLLGDPAMRLAIPEATVAVDSINGIDVSTCQEPPVIKARQQVSVTGHVTDSEGNALNDYNGAVMYTMYDAEYSTTTHGNNDGVEVTFEQQGTRLVSGRATAKDGKFELNILMPSEISDNYRPAALNIFVDGGSTQQQAVTNFRDFYVYDTDWDAAPDDTAPVIESMYMNNPAFSNGDIVNPSPMFIATISDDKALNMSMAGIGHQMLLTLDGKTTYTDVSNFFTPDEDGSPSGTIAYPLEDLTDGPHELRLRIWDTSANSAVETIEFNVDHGCMPKLYDIYSDANPASVQANFYLVHDRPEQMIEVTVTVYNMLGKPVWSATQTQRSDMFGTTPITWNLCDNAGRRVGRGIYLYRASISQPGLDGVSDTATKRIAVTGQ